MKDSPNEKKNYEAPLLTVVTFKVEKGYAESGIASYFMHLNEYDQEVGTTFGRSSYGSATEDNGNQQSWF